MPIPAAKRAQKLQKLRAKHEGTMVTIRWTEWPNGKPDTDPTTGASIATDEMQPLRKSATVRAFVHVTAPITTGSRQYSEVAAGDAIVDFPLDLLRITDPGDTAFIENQIVDEIAFSQANRTTENSAIGEPVEPSDLEGVTMEFNGYKWVQKEIGDELVKNWDVVYAGINLSRAFLMCKS